MLFLDWVCKLASEITSQPIGRQHFNNGISRIETGKYVFIDPFQRKILRNPVKGLKPQIELCETNMERVKEISRHFSEKRLKKYVDTLDKTLKKHELTAIEFLERSEALYKLSLFYSALRCSSLGFMFMPNYSSSVPRLHAKRAAILFKLKEYEECMNDADISIDLLAESPFEYNIIEEMCSLKLTSRNLYEEESISETSIKRLKMIKKRKEYHEVSLYRVFGKKNRSIPSAGSYISIVEHSWKGRTVVFTQDLKAGTTVIVEDPYVTALTEAVKFETSHCSYCSKNIMSVVPCDDCVFAAYCSPKCRANDSRLHRYECPCLNYLHAIRISSTDHLAFRAVCRAGPEYMRKLFEETKGGLPQASNLPKGFNPKTRIYESDDYFQVYNLIHHDDCSCIENQSWLAYSLVKLLQIRTDFFHRIKKKNLESFFNFVVSALLQNMISFPYNVISLWEPPARPAPSVPGKKVVLLKEDADYPMLVGVFSLCSLMCHSCYPTGIRLNLDCGKMAIVTSRRVSAGEELTISYGYECTSHPKQERERRLQHAYLFKCDCVACLYDWPMKSGMSTHTSYLCPECGPRTSYKDITKLRRTRLFNQHLLKGACKTCSQEYTMQDLIDQVEECSKRIKNVRDLIVHKRSLAALPIIIDCVEFLQGRVMPPAIQIYEAQELLYSALDDISTTEPDKTPQQSFWNF